MARQSPTVSHLQPRDEVVCDFCARDVYVRPPPPEGFRGPWLGSKAPRITPHWSNPMKERKMSPEEKRKAGAKI